MKIVIATINAAEAQAVLAELDSKGIVAELFQPEAGMSELDNIKLALMAEPEVAQGTGPDGEALVDREVVYGLQRQVIELNQRAEFAERQLAISNALLDEAKRSLADGLEAEGDLEHEFSIYDRDLVKRIEAALTATGTLHAPVFGARLRHFPTMLRKMWSGGEVQHWINEYVAPLFEQADLADTMAKVPAYAHLFHPHDHPEQGRFELCDQNAEVSITDEDRFVLDLIKKSEVQPMLAEVERLTQELSVLKGWGAHNREQTVGLRNLISLNCAVLDKAFGAVEAAVDLAQAKATMTKCKTQLAWSGVESA